MQGLLEVGAHHVGARREGAQADQVGSPGALVTNLLDSAIMTQTTGHGSPLRAPAPRRPRPGRRGIGDGGHAVSWTCCSERHSRHRRGCSTPSAPRSRERRPAPRDRRARGPDTVRTAQPSWLIRGARKGSAGAAGAGPGLRSLHAGHRHGRGGAAERWGRRRPPPAGPRGASDAGDSTDLAENPCPASDAPVLFGSKQTSRTGEPDPPVSNGSSPTGSSATGSSTTTHGCRERSTHDHDPRTPHATRSE